MKLLSGCLNAGLCAVLATFSVQGFAAPRAQAVSEAFHATANVPGGKTPALPGVPGRRGSTPPPAAQGKPGPAPRAIHRTRKASNTSVVPPGGVMDLHWGRAGAAHAAQAKPGQPDFVVYNSNGSAQSGPSDDKAKPKAQR